MEVTLLIGATVEAIYSDEAVDLLEAVGNVAIERASHVEPVSGGWSADLSPVGGPVLGPFARRGAAIEAEIVWLKENRGL